MAGADRLGRRHGGGLVPGHGLLSETPCLTSRCRHACSNPIPACLHHQPCASQCVESACRLPFPHVRLSINKHTTRCLMGWYTTVRHAAQLSGQTLGILLRWAGLARVPPAAAGHLVAGPLAAGAPRVHASPGRPTAWPSAWSPQSSRRWQTPARPRRHAHSHHRRARFCWEYEGLRVKNIESDCHN